MTFTFCIMDSNSEMCECDCRMGVGGGVSIIESSMEIQTRFLLSRRVLVPHLSCIFLIRVFFFRLSYTFITAQPTTLCCAPRLEDDCIFVVSIQCVTTLHIVGKHILASSSITADDRSSRVFLFRWLVSRRPSLNRCRLTAYISQSEDGKEGAQKTMNAW